MSVCACMSEPPEARRAEMRCGTAVTIEAMFFLSLPNLAAAAVLECSREVLTCRMQMPVSCEGERRGGSLMLLQRSVLRLGGVAEG